ncbi:MAG TPA: hypothetical protein VG709_01915 [Actinomycetota bacterium]|nr:hypothetical protein [Actinomycetota bacterium]
MAAIAFGAPVVAVDTNVRRVVGRACLGADDGDVSADDVGRAAAGWLGSSDPAAWNQAVMDLGREVCRPAPRCNECPIADACTYRGTARHRSTRERRVERFEGSTRQLRGRIVAELRRSASLTLDELAASADVGRADVAAAVASLAADGLVAEAPGRRGGGIRLAP